MGPLVTDIPRSAMSSTTAGARLPCSSSFFLVRRESLPSMRFLSGYGLAMKIWVRHVAGQLAGVVQAGLFPDAHWLTFQIRELLLGSGVADA